MKAKYKNVVLEGVTCVGKTTVGKALSDLLKGKWIYDKSILSDNNRGRSIRKLTKEDSNSIISQRLWLLDVILHEYEVRQLLENNNLVRDRSYRSFISFNKFYDIIPQSEKEILLKSETLLEKISPEPDLIILLTASKEHISSRMETKSDVSEIDRKLLEGDFIEKIEADLMRSVSKCSNYQVITTDSYNINQIISKVYEVIKSELLL